MSPNVGKGVDTPVGRVNCSVGARVWLVPAWATATEAESRTVSFIILLDRLSMGQLDSSGSGEDVGGLSTIDAKGRLFV